MRRTGTWLCLVTLLVVSAVAATTASAAEYELEGLPAIGRCVPSPAHNGEYVGNRCVARAEGKGAYDFLPGPGPAPKFEGAIGSTVLETVGRQTVVNCASGVATGEYTGQKTANVALALAGCVRTAAVTQQKCQTNPAKEGEIETQPIEGEFGYIRGGSKPKVGLDLKPSTPISFTCGALPEVPSVVTVEGSAIGAWAPANSMRATFNATYTAQGGKQVPEKFESGLKDTLSLTRVTGVETSTAQAGLTIRGAQLKPKALVVKNEERLEVKAK
jgi:hypothetical protein